MKRKRYTEEQIISFLKAHEQGAKLPDLVRKHGFSEQSFYRMQFHRPEQVLIAVQLALISVFVRDG